MSESNKKDGVVVIIDGNSVIYRAFYNVPPLSSNGVPTGVIHVFLLVLEKLKNNPEVSDIIIVFDAKGKNRRHDMLESYKATREAMPEDLIVQLNILKEILPYTGYPLYSVEGYEADDVIYTLARNSSSPVWIVTKDKDLHQLVDDRVKIYDYQKDEVIDREKVYQKFELYPEKICDMLALSGDTSDNIPGVAGVGPKGAKKLLDEYGSLENIYSNLDKLKGKQKENLEKGKEMAFLSKELVKLIYIENIEPFNCVRDEDKLREYFEKYNLKHHLQSLSGSSADIKSDELEPVQSLQQGTVENKEITVYFNGKVYVCGNGFYEETEACETDFYYDVKSLLKKGIKVPDRVYDLMLISWLIDPDTGGIKARKDETAGEFMQRLLLAKDSIIQQLKDKQLEDIYYRIELPVAHVLSNMETNGILVDENRIRIVAEKLAEAIEKEYKFVCSSAGFELNLNSPKQLGSYLYDKLGLKASKKNKSGYSTDEETLNDLLRDYPEYNHVLSSILKYRELNKLYSTYTLNLLEYVGSDGRIHTEFKQTGTATGRLSSSNPNMQNIPQKGGFAEELRSSFKASEGYSLVSFDYSQIELRILAHLSEDENLLKAFNNGIDIHTMTAEKIFHLSSGSVVTPEMRRIAKAVNFGILYGLSSYGLSRDTKVSQKEAKEFIEGYFSMYPSVKVYTDRLIEETRRNGYCETILGRKRFISDINSRNGNIRMRAERMAVNAPIQGSAADIIKLAMTGCMDYINEYNIDAKMILQIHDELIFEVNNNILDEFKKKIKNIMEDAVSLKVKMEVNVESGSNWGML